MSGFEDHRARAVDCVQRSRETQDEESRVFFLSMAQLWMALAHEHVRMERLAEYEINTDHMNRMTAGSTRAAEG